MSTGVLPYHYFVQWYFSVSSIFSELILKLLDDDFQHTWWSVESRNFGLFDFQWNTVAVWGSKQAMITLEKNVAALQKPKSLWVGQEEHPGRLIVFKARFILFSAKLIPLRNAMILRKKEGRRENQTAHVPTFINHLKNHLNGCSAMALKKYYRHILVVGVCT